MARDAADDDAERSDEEEWRVIDDALLDAEEKMEKAVAVARDDLASIRTGRANPGMFARIHVEYYGTPTPIQQLASFTAPEARIILVSPFDVSAMPAIEMREIKEIKLFRALRRPARV